MPVQHAVLALLREGESYGYELHAAFQETVGPQWGKLNIGHLYQVLERLVRDGLVTRRSLDQPRRPDRVLYQLTESGHDELDRWLKTPFVRQSGYRDDFFLKIAAAARIGANALDEVLRSQRAAYLAEIASLTELRAAHREEPVIALLIEAAILHTRANLEVIDRAEGSVEQLVAAGSTGEAAAKPDDARKADTA